MRIFYAATHAWKSPIRVGSHYISSALSRYNPLVYSSHPISLASLFSQANNQLKERWDLVTSHPKEVAHNLSELTWLMPLAPSPAPLLRSKFVVRYGWRATWPPLKSTIRNLKLDGLDQLWLDTFFQNFWIDALEPRSLYIRVADHPQHITSLSTSLQQQFEKGLNLANRIITPTEHIANYLATLTQTPISIIHNGVNTADFNRAHPRPIEYGSDEQTNIVFVGALARWIDTNLIAQLAATLKMYNFWLIGPRHVKSQTKLPANAKFLGPIPYRHIQPYLVHANAALAPFDVTGYPDLMAGVDAVKLYEYIAAKTPVIATRWPQSLRLTPYVTPVDQTAQSFASALENVVRDPESHIASNGVIASLDWEKRLASLSSYANASTD